MRTRRHAWALAAGLAASLLAAGAVYALAPRFVAHPSATSAPSGSPTPTLTSRGLAAGDLAGQVLDPAAIPEGTVVRAALLVGLAGRDGRPGLTLAWDADTGAWVRTNLRDDAAQAGGLVLSPEGTRLLERRRSADGQLTLEVLRLATGETQTVPVPPRSGDCELDDAAWAPDSVHVAVIWGCGRYARSAVSGPLGKTWEPYDTWVDEVDLLSGTSRVVEHALDTYPGETYASYSPDGRVLVYGAGPLTGGELSTLRVVALDGSGAVSVPGDLHIVYGDPWLTAGTALAWDEDAEIGAADAFTVVDSRTGQHAALGVPDLLDLTGVVGGSVLVKQTDWLDRPNPCSVALCRLDPASGSVTPWLDVVGGESITSVQAARALILR